jgi:mRNA-degrading endonuclease RelE of RelBE toxin-antitoxin system
VSYSIEIDRTALDDIRRLPKPIQAHIAKSLRRLELEYALGDLAFDLDVLYRFDANAGTVNVFQVMCEYV